MNYINEHVWLGVFGQSMIYIAFLGAVLSAYCYLKPVKKIDEVPLLRFWRRLGRSLFLISAVSGMAAIIALYFLIINHYFEFYYVWKYTARDMEPGFLIASFWSGQEGSLLIWAFWIFIFSGIILSKHRHWEAPVLGVAGLTLAFIFSMCLGFDIGDVRIGSNPFMLLRKVPGNEGLAWPTMTMPSTGMPVDGQGLNPLLKNFWMAVHPPVLFAGFAATVFPFAFSLAGLWSGKKDSWLMPARYWTLMGLFWLGAGILLGGAWAYEALSFGGFWAWDPLENASLVPWLTLVGAVHSIKVTAKAKRSYFLSFILCLLPFLLVIYASFLTRSGILGESSVHAFTDNGLMPHLLLFLFFFMMLAMISVLKGTKMIYVYFGINVILLILVFMEYHGATVLGWLILNIALLAFAYEKYYAIRVRDDGSAREFWMIAGTIILLVAAFQIILSTSVPVVNRLFGTSFDAFADLATRNIFYASWQVPFAAIAIFLMAFVYLLKYRKTTDIRGVFRQLAVPFFVAAVMAIAIILFVPGVRQAMYSILLFICCLAVASNVAWAARKIKLKRISGAAISHTGFALVIAGALISGSGKTAISINESGVGLQTLDAGFLNNENILLRKGDTLSMGNYFVLYRGKTNDKSDIRYNIGFYGMKWDGADKKMVPGDSSFTLYPKIQRDDKYGTVAVPDTRHFVAYDIFAHVKWADMEINAAQPDDDFMSETVRTISVDEEWQHSNMLVSLDDIYLLSDRQKKEELGIGHSDVAIEARISIRDVGDPAVEDIVYPIIYIKDSTDIIVKDVYSETFQSLFRIKQLEMTPNTVLLGIQEREYLVLQALIFPGMMVLWAGCAVMLLGLAMAIFQRAAKARRGIEKG